MGVADLIRLNMSFEAGWPHAGGWVRRDTLEKASLTIICTRESLCRLPETLEMREHDAQIEDLTNIKRSFPEICDT